MFLLVCADLQPCPNAATNCSSCVMENPSCGWCASIRQCLNGTGGGPIGGFCDSTQWFFAQSVPPLPPTTNPCPNCSYHRSCVRCGQDPSCSWCMTSSLNGTCYNADNKPTDCTPTAISNCPCNQFPSCHDCLLGTGSSCVFCGHPAYTCQAASAAPSWCNSKTEDNCSCATYSSCFACATQEGCFWCPSSKSCQFFGQSSCVPSSQGCSEGFASSFDGGSFVGGILLVMGVLLLIVLGWYGYSWWKGSRGSYEQLGAH